MSAIDTIMRKRDGLENSRGELEELIAGCVDGSVPQYQVSSWLMAVFLNGLTPAETGNLTEAMIHSGSTLSLDSLGGPLVDKHSTGGVGDKVSLILAPMVAACGVQVPMMSGRALGHTGGTLDKLESIPGYTTALAEDRFVRIIESCGFAMTGQSKNIVPADRVLYALRDVTGTVESIPLITASILSKKFAEGAESLVFDVKCGSGAFMKSLDAAESLSDSLRAACAALGKPVATCITRMEQPLGLSVGNFLEVEESVLCLSGGGPADLMEVTYRLGAWMLKAAGIESSIDRAEQRCRQAIASGNAYERFLKNVHEQGGDSACLERPMKRPEVEHVIESVSDGYIAKLDAYAFGRASGVLGAGRERADESVAPDVGIVMARKVGDEVAKGTPIARLYTHETARLRRAIDYVESAVHVESQQVESTYTSMILSEKSAL